MATFFRFSSLPNEITLHIIETSDPEDIENLALCCKRVYSLAGKTLAQHKADKTRLSDLCFSVTRCFGSELRLNALTKLQVIATNRRLQRYPTLAQACDDIFKGLESPYITKDELEVWYNKLVQGMVPCYDRHSTTANSLLLTLLPNVKCMRICYLEQMSREMADMIHTISRINQDAAPFMRNRLSLTKLYEIPIESSTWYHEGQCETGVVEAFMTLSSLRILRLLNLGPDYTFSKWLNPTPQSNVTEIHCIHCGLNATQLERLLERVKCLRVFSYDHYSCGLSRVKQEVSPGALLDVIFKNAGTSLRYLNVTTDVRKRRTKYTYKYRIGPVGSFRGFEALKTMRLSRVILFEDNEDGKGDKNIEEEVPKKLVDELPASIEELELVEKISREEAQLMFAGMLEMKQERLPKLRYVAFEGRIPFDEETVSTYRHAGLVLDCAPRDLMEIENEHRKSQLRLGGIECIRF